MAIRDYFYAFLNLILGCKNPWGLLLILLGFRNKVAIKVKSKPETLSISATKRNYKILYYICLLRNQQRLVFQKGYLVFPPHRLVLKQDELLKERLAVILLASKWGLLLSEYNEKHYVVTLKNGLKFKVRKDNLADINAIIETFCKKVYDEFCCDIKGKVVLDIGAFIGDTPLMFSTKGAKLVIAYEPDPIAYKLALENIKLNNISNIRLINAGIGNKRRIMKIKAYAQDKEVIAHVLPLDQIVKDIGEIDLIKMDCEGCEFSIMSSVSNETLSKVKELIIEYHDYPEPIVKKLESAGFIVKVKKPWCICEGKPVGFLYAKKKISCA